MSNKKKRCANNNTKTDTEKEAYNWIDFLNNSKKFNAAPVHLFSNINISINWQKLVRISLKVEVKNKDAVLPSNVESIDDSFWIATIVQTQGFWVLLRFEGYEEDDSDDFWMHIYSPELHPVGYTYQNKKYLLPPKNILKKQTDWRNYIVRRLTNSHTLPTDFREQITESLRSNFRTGLNVEAWDINRVSSVRCASVVNVIGSRLHIAYDPTEELNHENSFWCDEKSSLIHPIGWAQLIGHELNSTKEYAESSLEKVKTGKWDEDDASFRYFPHLYKQMKEAYLPDIDADCKKLRFEKNMRIEAIDALNTRNISVATVFKVLRYDFLMIGIDGMMEEDGSDCFCYHRSEFFPVGFCKKYKIDLSTPYDNSKKFDYSTYLKNVNAIAAPEDLFKDETPDSNHAFKRGMYIEATDLMEPHLVCPAIIKKVANKLLKIGFIGWGEEYDQWVDYRSPEIYPVGYCEIVGYHLQQPENANEQSKKEEIFGTSAEKKTTRSSTSKASTSKKKSTVKSINSRAKYKKGRPFKSSGQTKRESTRGKSIKAIEKYNANFDDSIQSLDSFELPEFNLNKETKMDLQSPATKKKEDNHKNESYQQEEKIPKRSENPYDWTIDQVRQYLDEKGFENYSKNFVENEMSGASLMNATREDFFQLMDKKLGPSLNLNAEIEKFRKKFGS